MEEKKRLDEFERALKGLDFPASRSAIVNKVRDIGGIDGRVVETAERLPNRTYDWERDAAREFDRVQHESIENTFDVPAAPSDLTGADKGLVEHMADPRRDEST
jgi:hypothetical protein